MLGHVSAHELARTARQGRSYALRAAYGMVLLAVVIASKRSHSGTALPAGAVARHEVATLARDLFRDLLLAQGAAVLLLTPAFVAGAIAGEVQRKTLGDLLTTDLGAAEIVLGKLAARLHHVLVLVSIGVPFLILAGVVGGVDPSLIALSLGATVTTAYFLGGLAILGSTQTRSVRGALNFVFTLALTWLILPGAIDVLLPRRGMAGLRLHEWLAPFNAWVAPSSPFVLYLDLLRGSIRHPEALAGRVLTLIGLQVLYGSILAMLAVASLRSSGRVREGGRPSIGVRPSRSERRIPCGDDPMLWKEVFVPRTPLLYRPLGVSIALVLGGLLLWGTIEFALPAFREVWVFGYGVEPTGSARGLFHSYLRIVGTGVSLVVALGVASDAAGSLTGERERDTWISLVATPLTGAEIVRGKWLGAVWGARHTAAILLLLGFAGVLAGALHPLGLALLAIELASSAAFSASLGIWVSLRSSDSMRAVARTMAALLLANAGPLLIALTLVSVRPIALAGCAPLRMAAALASPGEVAGRPGPNVPGRLADTVLPRLWAEGRAELIAACLLGACGSALGAYGLTRSACRGFDAQLDRPALDMPAVVRANPKAPRASLGRLRQGRPLSPPGRRRPRTGPRPR